MANPLDHEKETVLQDLGIEEGDLEQIVSGQNGPNALMPRRLEEAGVDKEVFCTMLGATLRDMARARRTCARSKASRRGSGGSGLTSFSHLMMASDCVNG